MAAHENWFSSLVTDVMGRPRLKPASLFVKGKPHKLNKQPHSDPIACQPSPHRTYGSSNSNWYVKFQMFMSARAFWRVSYFAVFYTEYLNFSWYYLIEAYIFSISIGRIIDNQLLQCIYPFILSLGDKNNTPKYRRTNVI